MRPAFSAALLLVLAAAPADARGRTFQPWPEAMPPAERKTAAPAAGESSPVKIPFLWSLWFYRNAISPLDGVRCGLYPTCAGYATDAVRKHGVLAGGFLAADRLIHEGSIRQPEYQRIEKFGRVFLHDPVEKNDRLFRGGPPRAEPPIPVIASFDGPAQPMPAALGDPEAVVAHARTLALAGDTYRAVGELRRAAFLELRAARSAELLVEAGFTAAAAGTAAKEGRPLSWTAGEAAFDEADRLFEDAARFATRNAEPLAAERAELARTMAYLSRGWLPEATRRFEALAASDGAHRADARWLGAWAAFSADLAQGRASVAAAESAFAPLREDPVRGEAARGVLAATREDRWKAKSPGLAAGLSFALPGAGFVYAGKPLVGIGSFLLNGAFIAGTVWAVRDGNYPLALILLSMETGWYVGGVNGAVSATIERNELGRRRYERTLRQRFLGGVWPGGAAGAILF